ncbi:hypothetical protein GGTG_06721 [Gaeumannomyces tritici R3-111a-1]|uniref:Phenazine biosynthesis PhzC/PhzF protein n=1 Tax=Gaeumannomyces tritici (strain R3-111a-1) TaxID=644352 RepID=J3NZM4_GAET3|nr:hypothetical protein GGTG_06721 [Gaeumannomyces tritici R3-111a-1]EJT76807.1 hypothetical protein GGTG_06721 [Gaeumannomyces tritici R3-111a-1]
MASPTLAQSLKFVTIDVFTPTRFAGNSLALVLLRPEDAKQRIAREFNLPKTAFLHLAAPGDNDGADTDDTDQLRLDIFTPREELPFTGHPTERYYFQGRQHVLGGQDTVRPRTRLLLESEDPATGSAASALACYLALSDSAGLGDWVAEGRALGAEETVFFEMEQGVEMGRHSVIHVEVEAYLGGTAVMVMEGTVRQ